MANQRIVDYIQQYRGQFPEQALRERLLADGFAPGEIEEAFAALAAPAAAESAASSELAAPGMSPKVRRILWILAGVGCILMVIRLMLLWEFYRARP